MKGVEKTNRQDGTVETNEFMIPMKKTDSRVGLKLLTPYNDEPIAVCYFETGWNYGYPTYHVIIEYGDFEQTDYLFLSHQQFVKKFGVDPMDDEQKGPVHSEFSF